MKLVCEKDNILKAINSVTKAVATKTTMPVLEGILIQTNEEDIFWQESKKVRKYIQENYKKERTIEDFDVYYIE